jgi:hypothetical protein
MDDNRKVKVVGGEHLDSLGEPGPCEHPLTGPQPWCDDCRKMGRPTSPAGPSGPAAPSGSASASTAGEGRASAPSTTRSK